MRVRARARVCVCVCGGGGVGGATNDFKVIVAEELRTAKLAVGQFSAKKHTERIDT